MTDLSTPALESLTAASLPRTAALPFTIEAASPGEPLIEALPRLRARIEEHLYTTGGVLFRSFAVDGAEGFRTFAAAFGHPLLSYEFGSTPRSKVTGGVYTSTEYPAHQSIPLHNEQAYTREWPMKIWFYCERAAPQGGETPIADSRAIYSAVDAGTRERFATRGLCYVRNFGNGMDVPWQQVFNTEDRAQVETYCARHGIVCEWKDDGELRTRQRVQGIAHHPHTGDPVWFNQAHLFHLSALAPEMREVLLDTVGEEDLPRNVYYGDGTPIPDAELDAVRAVLDVHKVVFPWREGDVLMLDNMLTAHAREPFSGPRKVVVAMAEPHGARA
ncbi:TauD/TfdA family dioxygenase [Cupriavidus gilardii]|uniref:TauD/TfdA family dioxygenase n=1 Tax=Cupriavidus gilardii TaxID=82541 RepID=A0ABY4VMB0_9BURK|nr:TauD/TfdA family dioxygenase [Cupriavidus gilardii]USE77174.1 TauD/TfdA family dioxygenase [Cupriavidus gilardii]